MTKQPKFTPEELNVFASLIAAKRPWPRAPSPDKSCVRIGDNVSLCIARGQSKDIWIGRLRDNDGNVLRERELIDCEHSRMARMLALHWIANTGLREDPA